MYSFQSRVSDTVLASFQSRRFTSFTRYARCIASLAFAFHRKDDPFDPNSYFDDMHKWEECEKLVSDVTYVFDNDVRYTVDLGHGMRTYVLVGYQVPEASFGDDGDKRPSRYFIVHEERLCKEEAEELAPYCQCTWHKIW